MEIDAHRMGEMGEQPSLLGGWEAGQMWGSKEWELTPSSGPFC